MAYDNGADDLSPRSKAFEGGIKTDTIGEFTSGSGVTISDAVSFEGLSQTINSDAAAGTNEDPSLVMLGGDGGSETIRSDIKQDSSADLLYVQMGGGAAGTTRKSPTFVVGTPGETTVSLDSTIRLEAAQDDGTNKTATLVLLGEEQSLTITAPNVLALSDGTGTITSTAGAITEAGLVSINLTPSGAVAIQGGGQSDYGDDTGVLRFDGSGALSTNGVTSITWSAPVTHSADVIGLPKVYSAPVNYNDTTVVAFTSEAGEEWIINRVWFVTNTSWDGNGTVEVGDGNDADGYLSLAAATHLVTTYDESGGITGWTTGSTGLKDDKGGVYQWAAATDDRLMMRYVGAETIDITVTAGTSAQGSGTCYVMATRIA